MNKSEFVFALSERLSFLPWNEVEERVSFYLEMIDDRMEDGMAEEEAVAAVGSVSVITEQILTDIPLSRIVKERIKPVKRMRGWEIVLLAVGSPLWLSLGIAAFAVILSLYVSLWTVVISLWSACVSVAACALCGAAGCILAALNGYIPAGLFFLAAGLVCGGVAILLGFVCKAATRGTALLARKSVIGIKNCFVRKEEA